MKKIIGFGPISGNDCLLALAEKVLLIPGRISEKLWLALSLPTGWSLARPPTQFLIADHADALTDTLLRP